MKHWILKMAGRKLAAPTAVGAMAIGALGASAPTVHAQQAGAANTAPEREITNVTGELYRFRQIRHIGMFLVTPEGIVVVDPTNSALAGWLKDQLDERFGLPVRYVINSRRPGILRCGRLRRRNPDT